MSSRLGRRALLFLPTSCGRSTTPRAGRRSKLFNHLVKSDQNQVAHSRVPTLVVASIWTGASPLKLVCQYCVLAQDGCLLQLKATVYAEVRLNVNGCDYEILEIDSEYKETDIVDLDNLGN
jgi:hypothetical protein